MSAATGLLTSGVFRVVTEAMAAAARTHATDRGVDYRGMPLFAFGGAGPVHACEVAHLLDSAAVIIPPQSSVLSAFGTLVTPVRLDLVRSAVGALDGLDWPRAHVVLDELAQEAEAALAEAGCPKEDMTLLFGADLRYVGQQSEVTVMLDADPRGHRDPTAIAKAFEGAYRGLYGVNPSHVPIELVNWRLTARGSPVSFHGASEPGERHGEPRRWREVHAWADAMQVPVYAREDLGLGQELQGPAIIEERETTTVLPPGWRATLNPFGCIVAVPATSGASPQSFAESDTRNNRRETVRA